MLFNGRALIFTFSRTQVRIAEHERLQSLFKTSMVSTVQLLYCAVVLSSSPSLACCCHDTGGCRFLLVPCMSSDVTSLLLVVYRDDSTSWVNELR